MPLYEYRCESCGRQFEFLQSLNDEPIGVCPECGGELRRLVSAPAFQFKGSGWYVTDYARGGGKGESGEGAKGGSDASKSNAPPASEAKSADPKPAVTAPAKGDKPTKAE